MFSSKARLTIWPSYANFKSSTVVKTIATNLWINLIWQLTRNKSVDNLQQTCRQQAVPNHAECTLISTFWSVAAQTSNKKHLPAPDKLINLSCPTANTPIVPSFRERIGAIPRVQVVADVKHEDSEDVRLKCYWESPGNLTNIEYEARWFADDKDSQPKIERSFTGLELAEFLFEPRVFKGVINQNPSYEFHKNVCINGHVINQVFNNVVGTAKMSVLTDLHNYFNFLFLKKLLMQKSLFFAC